MVRPTKRAAGDDAAPPSRRLRVMPLMADAPGSSNSELPPPPPPSPPRKRFASIVLVVLFSILPVKRATDSLRIGRLETGLKALRHELRQVRDTLLRKQNGIKKLIRALSSKLDTIKGTPPNHHNHEHVTRECTRQEGTAGLAETKTEAQDTSIRLRFCSGMKPPIYHDDDISPIKIEILDGDRRIESADPLSKLKIEVLALEGNFPYNAEDSWTSKEFDEHVAYGRDGRGNVLVGEGTKTQLINGECYIGSIRFRESSCRARSGKFIIAARVRGGQSNCDRIQEAVTNPVVVLDRRNKYNEKRYPPNLDDDVYRLENISKNGEYRKKLEKHGIRTVEHFLKALSKDENRLRSILDIKPKNSKIWDKMVAHAQTCCLDHKPELKSYWCNENMVLFFDYVHRLVGARFGNHYIASDNFEPALKNLVDTMKKNAYDQLDGLPGDYVMKDNIPVWIGVNTEGGAGPSCMTSSAPQQINFGHHVAANKVEDIPESKVFRPCAPHDPNSIADPNSTSNYQASSTRILQNAISVGDITTVEGFIHGLNASFAVANDGPSTSSSVPCQLTTQNYQAQQQQQHFLVVNGMPQHAQAFPQHQADGAPGLHPGEMPGGDTLEESDYEDILSYMLSTPEQALNNTGAASLPNDGTMGTSVSAQPQWSQCQGNMPGNTSF